MSLIRSVLNFSNNCNYYGSSFLIKTLNDCNILYGSLQRHKLRPFYRVYKIRTRVVIKTLSFFLSNKVDGSLVSISEQFQNCINTRF